MLKYGLPLLICTLAACGQPALDDGPNSVEPNPPRFAATYEGTVQEKQVTTDDVVLRRDEYSARLTTYEVSDVWVIDGLVGWADEGQCAVEIEESGAILPQKCGLEVDGFWFELETSGTVEATGDQLEIDYTIEYDIEDGEDTGRLENVFSGQPAGCSSEDCGSEPNCSGDACVDDGSTFMACGEAVDVFPNEENNRVYRWDSCEDDNLYHGSCSRQTENVPFDCNCMIDEVTRSDFDFYDAEQLKDRDTVHEIFNENCGWNLPPIEGW